MKILIILCVTNAVFNLVSCQSQSTKSSRIQWQASLGATGSGVPIPFGDHIDWSAYDGLIKVDPILDGKESINAPAPSTNLLLPVLPDMPPPPPQLADKTAPPAVTAGTKTATEQPVTTHSAPLVTPTTPKPIKIDTTTVPKPNIPPTPPPTIARPTVPPPVIMVQHSLSGLAGPSEIISQANEWIASAPTGASNNNNFAGIGVASAKADFNIAPPSQQASQSQPSGMESFIGMLTPEQKRALRALLDGTPVTTTPKPTTPAPKLPTDMQALKMKMMQSMLGSRSSPANPMQAMLATMGQGGGDMGGMGGMSGMGGMDMAALIEAMGGGSTDPGEHPSPMSEMPASRLGPRMGSAGLGGRGRGLGRGDGSGNFQGRDPMMQRMLLERQMRGRPGFDPSEAGGEGLSPLLMAAMLSQGGTGAGGDLTGMMSLMGGMGGAGGGDMTSLLSGMGSGAGGAAGTAGMDMNSIFAAMESASGSTQNQNSTSGSAARDTSTGMDMSSLLGGMGGLGGGMGGLGGGMGGNELQMMMALMGGADAPDMPARGMFGLKKRSAGPGPSPQRFHMEGSASSTKAITGLRNQQPKENSVKKSSTFSAKTQASASSSQIPAWLMNKLISSNNAASHDFITTQTTPTVMHDVSMQTAPTSGFAPTASSNKFMFRTPQAPTTHAPSMMDHSFGTHMMGMSQTGSATHTHSMPGMGSMNHMGAMNGMTGTGMMGMAGIGAAAAAQAPISSNMSPAQIETMFTAIGLIPDQIRDISGGTHGMASMLPEDIKIRAIQMRASGLSPDQIADTLGDVMQARRAAMQTMGTGMMMG